MLEEDADYQHVFFPIYPFTTSDAYRGGFFTQRNKAVFSSSLFLSMRREHHPILS